MKSVVRTQVKPRGQSQIVYSVSGGCAAKSNLHDNVIVGLEHGPSHTDNLTFGKIETIMVGDCTQLCLRTPLLRDFHDESGNKNNDSDSTGN